MSRIFKAVEKAEAESVARMESNSVAQATTSVDRFSDGSRKVEAETAMALSGGVAHAQSIRSTSRIHEAVQKAAAEAATLKRTSVPAPNNSIRFFDGVKQVEAEGAAKRTFDRVAGATQNTQASTPSSPLKAIEIAPVKDTSADAPVSTVAAGLGNEPGGAVDPPEPPRSGPQVSWVPPDWRPDPGTLILSEGGDWAFAEQFRTLRSRLLNLHQTEPFSTLLVCSALPGEGKTFVAANLAHALAHEEKKRVVLIDADLRAGRHLRLHNLLGCSFEHGLSDYLAGEAVLDEVMQTDSVPNLSFIPAGTLRQSSAELLGNGRLPALLTRLSSQWDWIVLDSPSFGPIADGLLLAQMCDASILVVRAGISPADASLRVAQELKRKRLLGVVLNCTAAGPARKSYRSVDNRKSSLSRGLGI